MKTDVDYSESDIDFLVYTNRVVEEENIVRDIAFERMVEYGYQVTVKDLNTGKKILRVVTDQITMDQEFDMDTGQDVMTLKILLSDEHIESSGDKEYMGENNEKY